MLTEVETERIERIVDNKEGNISDMYAIMSYKSFIPRFTFVFWSALNLFHVTCT